MTEDGRRPVAALPPEAEAKAVAEDEPRRPTSPGGRRARRRGPARRGRGRRHRRAPRRRRTRRAARRRGGAHQRRPAARRRAARVPAPEHRGRRRERQPRHPRSRSAAPAPRRRAGPGRDARPRRSVPRPRCRCAPPRRRPHPAARPRPCLRAVRCRPRRPPPPAAAAAAGRSPAASSRSSPRSASTPRRSCSPATTPRRRPTRPPRRPRRRPRARPRAAAAAAASATSRADTTVAVFNGTTVNGLASQTTDKLAGSGYKRGSTGDYTDQQRAASTVFYRRAARRPGAQHRPRARHLRPARDGRRDAGAGRRARGRRGRGRQRQGALRSTPHGGRGINHLPSIDPARPRRLRAAGGGDASGRSSSPSASRAPSRWRRSRSVKRFFSPNGDGRRDVNRITFTVTEAGRVTVTIVDRDGERVRRLTDGIEARPGTPVRVVWDGRTDDGRARPGRPLPDAGRAAAHRPHGDRRRLLQRRHDPAAAGRASRSRRRSPGRCPARSRSAPAASARRRAPRFRILRTDVSPVVEVARFRGRAGSRRGVWDGLVDGAPAPPGTYMVVVAVRDRSGNEGTAPAVLPPVRGQVRGKPGITVRQITAQPPLEPVRAGAARRVLRRLAAALVPLEHPPRRASRGRSSRGSGLPGRTLAVRAPRRRLGRVPAAAALRPLQRPRAVPRPGAGAGAAAGRGARPSRGSASTRSTTTATGCPTRSRPAGPCEWPRVIAGDQGLPATFADQTAPLLVFLDRARIRYDLTSDIALARSRDPRATDREGVVLAGPLRWVPRTLARRLRRYVEDGGRLASFGTESLRRGVRVGAEPPHAPDAADADGPVRRAPRAARAPARRRGGGPLPLTALADDPALGLLTGSDGVVDAFGRLEESQARRGAAAREGGRSALGQDVTEAERAEAEDEGRAAARRAARADRDAAREGLRGARRAHRLGGAGRAWTARSRQITRNIIDVLRRVEPRVRSGPLEDPALHHPQPQRRDVEVGRDRERERRARPPRPCAASSSPPRSCGSGSPYQSSAAGWRASSAPAR